ncbi:MAG: hypothetical protein GY757_11285, partial [bacterium]|nr:hypothetical protein [bacterium]
KPQFSFLKDGLFLPSANNKKIGFKTMNLKKIKVTVKKVFESNLGQFLQSQQVNARKQRTERFYDYDIKRVGVTVAEKEFKIGETRNQWLTHQLDLAQLIKANEKGLFIISLSFTKKDMLYKTAGKKQNHYYGRGYYSNPDSRGYIYRHGRVVKPVILSDIGLTYKKGASQHLVFASNLLDAKPLKDVTVTIRTFQNQVIATQKTDANGKAFFENIKETVFFLEAEKDGQRSMIKPAEMGWNLSTFDTGGVTIQPQETRAFIYTERGVYRPGDPVNLSVIARNIDNTFPDGHPVTLKLYNPKSQLIVSQTSKKARDGFYNFKFKTKTSDPTGSWKAKIHVGSLVFYHTLKIETVVPNRLKVKILPEEKTLSRKNKYIKFDVESTYLFGSPAANLKSKVSITFKHLLKKFPRFQGYSFNNQSVPFRSINTEVFNRNLDPTGKVDISWLLPDLTHLPSAATAAISAKVFEKGGRFTRMDHSLLMDPFDYYVGLEKPNFRWGYSRVGAPLKINAVVLDKDGKTAAGRQLKYRIYKNSRYWWWEYRNRNNFRVRYKKDKYTHLLKEGELISRDIPLPISFKPENTGEYLIEVEDTDKGGHKAGFFFSAYYWGDAPSGMETAGTLTLKSSKKVYAPGETAIISFPEPQTGSLFVTVEKANRILSSTIYACKGGPGEESERKIEIPVTPEMLPNAYVSVSIIQPHSQTLNDRPLRMYGVIPLMVEEPQTRQAVELKMADKLRPKQEFEVKVETGDKKPTQFTVAVVDEGLLDLTRFLTPDPWKEFYKKQKLGIHSFDLFSFVIGATKGDISSLFSIGGGSDDYRKSQEEPGKVKRFKPVAMFKGPLQTDANGKATVTFKMPDYIGSVRVMVVTANGNRYGCTEKAVPVKTELMVMPTLPRVLGPTDKFRVPVTVFAMEDKIKKVDVSIELEGPIELEGTNRSSLEFTGPGDKDTSFVIKTQPAVGSAAVTVTAKSGKFKAVKRTEINIRPSSPRIYSSEIKDCEPKNSIKIKIPDRGIPGTNRAVIRVMRKPKLNLDHRLGWLIRYPYGCIEQTVSSVFPQLYLKEFMKQNDESERDIDSNINEAIEGLSRFQLPSGAFAYWPGDKSASHWGTSYAGHFLLEAKKLGYNVPAELYSRWLRFMESQTLVTSNENVMTRTYRVYVLALAGKPQMGPMNLLKENHLKKMSGTGKWMLAAAYHLAGSKETAKEVFKNASLHVEKYCDTGGTYGSNI